MRLIRSFSLAALVLLVAAPAARAQGHEVLARWTIESPHHTVITQNVDDLHVRARTQRLVRLHGSIWELTCWNDCGAPRWRDERVPLPAQPATCTSCGGLARPAVVWFGESLSSDDVNAALAACSCDVFMRLTARTLIPWASQLPASVRFDVFAIAHTRP